VPVGFGFTYMMIKLAKESERKAKLHSENAPQKVATINLSEKWINWLLIALLAFQVLLNIAAYNAALTGMKNVSLFFIGIILLVFAGFFHIYRYGLAQAKNPPPPPPNPELEEKPKLQEPQPVLENKKLPEGLGQPEDKKELSPEIKTPKVQADVGFDVNKNTTIGSADITKP
ncbi:MAG TPA: cytochrome bc complex cytochrome b subunit, partial [Nitrosopumilaceae archaeon]|nr:cytochrome bc complex cytochrome b subunit [Nitrosopumilaceae archaeon]